MHVINEHADRFLAETTKNFEKQGIENYTDPGYIDAFQEQLNHIAKKTQYKEGDQIKASDLYDLNNTIKMIFDDMVKGMIERRVSLKQVEQNSKDLKDLDGYEYPKRFDEMKQRGEIEKAYKKSRISPREEIFYDPFSAMLAVNDHLYAMAMKTLGSPDIPECFGSEIISHIKRLSPIAEQEIKASEYKKTNVEKVYKNQRGTNAAKLKSKVSKNAKEIKDKKASPIVIAQYAGEYQALKKRQEGHGKVWKFFHKKENEERTKLLETMKKVLEGAFDKDAEVDIDTLSPKDIAKAYHQISIADRSKEAFTIAAFCKRTQLPQRFFEQRPKSTELADKEREELYKSGNDPAKIEFDGEVRKNIEFDRELFKESEPIVFVDAEGKYGPKGKVYTDNETYQELEFSDDFKPGEIPMVK